MVAQPVLLILMLVFLFSIRLVDTGIITLRHPEQQQISLVDGSINIGVVSYKKKPEAVSRRNVY
jgi:hypothetical protein